MPYQMLRQTQVNQITLLLHLLYRNSHEKFTQLPNSHLLLVF